MPRPSVARSSHGGTAELVLLCAGSGELGRPGRTVFRDDVEIWHWITAPRQFQYLGIRQPRRHEPNQRCAISSDGGGRISLADDASLTVVLERQRRKRPAPHSVVEREAVSREREGRSVHDSRRIQTKRFMQVAFMDDDVVHRDHLGNRSHAIGEGRGPAQHRKDLGCRGGPLLENRVYGTAPPLADLTCGQRIAVSSHRPVGVLVEQTIQVTELARRSTREIGDNGHVMGNQILNRPGRAGTHLHRELLRRERGNKSGHAVLNLGVGTPHIAHRSHPFHGSPRRWATLTGDRPRQREPAAARRSAGGFLRPQYRSIARAGLVDRPLAPATGDLRRADALSPACECISVAPGRSHLRGVAGSESCRDLTTHETSRSASRPGCPCPKVTNSCAFASGAPRRRTRRPASIAHRRAGQGGAQGVRVEAVLRLRHTVRGPSPRRGYRARTGTDCHVVPIRGRCHRSS
jgi:hypothetical protein